MKPGYRIWMTAALVIALAVFLAAPAQAFGPHRFGHGPDFKKIFLAHLDERVEELNLSEDQLREYQALRAQLETRLEQGAARRKAVFEQLDQEINQEKPDMKAVIGLFRQGLEDIPARMSTGLDLFEQFYDILTEEQQARFIEKARKKINFIKKLHR